MDRNAAAEQQPINQQPLILAVDDDPDFLEMLTTKLKEAGFKTATAKNGKEGVAAAKALVPAFVILDVQMPVMDGITALAEMRKDPALAQTNIFLISSFKDLQKQEIPKEERQARKSGAQGFFSKATDLDKIVAEVRKLAP